MMGEESGKVWVVPILILALIVSGCHYSVFKGGGRWGALKHPKMQSARPGQPLPPPLELHTTP